MRVRRPSTCTKSVLPSVRISTRAGPSSATSSPVMRGRVGRARPQCRFSRSDSSCWMRPSRCRIERWLSAMTARHSSTVTLASSSLPALVAHLDLEIADALLGHLEVGVLLGRASACAAASSRSSSRICSSRAAISARSCGTCGSMDASASARRGRELRLALLARGKIGFEHRDLGVAARDRGAQVHDVGVEAPRRAVRWRRATRASAPASARCARELTLERCDAIGAREQFVFELRLVGALRRRGARCAVCSDSRCESSCSRSCALSALARATATLRSASAMRARSLSSSMRRSAAASAPRSSSMSGGDGGSVTGVGAVMRARRRGSRRRDSASDSAGRRGLVERLVRLERRGISCVPLRSRRSAGSAGSRASESLRRWPASRVGFAPALAATGRHAQVSVLRSTATRRASPRTRQRPAPAVRPWLRCRRPTRTRRYSPVASRVIPRFFFWRDSSPRRDSAGLKTFRADREMRMRFSFLSNPAPAAARPSEAADAGLACTAAGPDRALGYRCAPMTMEPPAAPAPRLFRVPPRPAARA